MAGPFSGILVVDLTHVLNGPFGTSMLCDLGARVIKIEPPEHGDDTRAYGPFVDGKSLYFNFVNRGKESIVLNLKHDADKAVLLRMVRKADVLAENFRPGTMQRLGLSYETLKAINPRLIYASSSGFGQTGPYAAYPAYDTIVQAMSGLMSMTGFPDGPPTRVGTSISDIAGGVFLFAGIASALYAREKTGRGAHVDVAMFDSTLAFLEHGLMEYSATGKPLGRIGNRHPFIAPFDTFAAQDTQFVICCGNDLLFERLCAALGHPELSSDSRFGSNADRIANNDALKAALEAALARRPAAYWLKLLHEAGIPVAPILNVTEAAEHPQTKARNMLIEAGGMRMTGNPLKIGGYDDPSLRDGAPSLDQNGAALRREFAPPSND
ncbi:MAG: CoA:oxalate CoA-transferase [Rhizomicrobium sp.]